MMYVVLTFVSKTTFFVHLDVIRTQSEPLVNRGQQSLNNVSAIQILKQNKTHSQGHY